MPVTSSGGASRSGCRAIRSWITKSSEASSSVTSSGTGIETWDRWDTVHLLVSATPTGGLGFGRLAEDLEEELLVEPRQLALGGRGEQLVGEVHEHAIVSGGVVGERGLELRGHQGGVAGGGEHVVEAGEQLVAGGVVEHEP